MKPNLSTFSENSTYEHKLYFFNQRLSYNNLWTFLYMIQFINMIIYGCFIPDFSYLTIGYFLYPITSCLLRVIDVIEINLLDIKIWGFIGSLYRHITQYSQNWSVIFLDSSGMTQFCHINYRLNSYIITLK